MRPTQDAYPSFEANQVLTSSYLNQSFDYLDEQERLTRANLIGIGIVCGLEIRLETGNTPAVHLSRGCGVTSEGYLLVEPDDLTLVSYRSYAPPDDLDYLPFRNTALPNSPFYQLWELLPAGEPNTTALGSPADFLDKKAVLLFLELKKEGLRNCSPDNCDDRGASVTATVRPLLINTGDLDAVIAKANALGSGLSGADVEAALLARLNLPDLRILRYDVPASGPATTQDVLAGFHAPIRLGKLAVGTGTALSAVYSAFQPLLIPAYPTDPFAGFAAAFGALDTAPASTTQVRFLQYYYDLFDDLRAAYDEFRWKGAELMCACCPPEGLFPRHLMLGLLKPSGAGSAVYRNYFLRSPASGGCTDRAEALVQLFRRLVEMTLRFTDTPKLAATSEITRTDPQIRITPSRVGEDLSRKAIPYYYKEDGDPQLCQIWNPVLTRRNRGNQNLSYRADEYTPAAPEFVTDPLRYDLEPYNFLRVEGHLGKNVRSALTTLLLLRNQFRLPVDIIALRTGAFDESITVDLSKEQCRFEDLEALFDALRDEFRCSLGKTLASLYGTKINQNIRFPQGVVPSIIGSFRPGTTVQPSTFGALVETALASPPGAAGAASPAERSGTGAGVPTGFGGLISGINLGDLVIGERPIVQASAAFVQVLLEIDAYLDSKALSAIDFGQFEALYKRLEDIQASVARQPDAAKKEWKDFADQVDAIRYACRMEAFRSITAEYRRRLTEVKQQQFLSVFLQKHPGIQHKAGVPVGGTFILVYHDLPGPFRPLPPFVRPGLAVDLSTLVASPRMTTVGAAASGLSESSAKIISAALGRLEVNRDLVRNPDIQTILGELTGQIPTLPPIVGTAPTDEAGKIIDETVKGMADGTIVADFFLPYLCMSNCAPIQYVLPPQRPAFDLQLECTNADGRAAAAIRPQGGISPYSIKVDDQDYAKLEGKPVLGTGQHTLTLRDSVGAESESQTVTVPPQLVIGSERFIDNGADMTYRIVFVVSGGAPPYKASIPGTFNDGTFKSDPLQSGASIKIEVQDAAGCKVSKEFTHSVCTLPCNGDAVRCRYLFWLPEPPTDGRYAYTSSAATLEIKESGGATLLSQDLLPAFRQALPDGTLVTTANYDDCAAALVKAVNSAAAARLGDGTFVLSLAPGEKGMVAVEHYACHDFTLDPGISLKQDDVSIEERWTYTPQGLKIRQTSPASVSYQVPAFGCLQLNKCNGNIKKDCTLGIKDISSKITQTGVRMKPVFSPAIDEGAAKFFWRTEYGSPASSTSAEVNCKWPPAGRIRVRVVVIDAAGCWGYFEKEFKKG